MKRYIKSSFGEDGWTDSERRMANAAWQEVDSYYHRDLSGAMNIASQTLESLGYKVVWDRSSNATTSIDAYKEVSVNGKTYTMAIWCYYYISQPSKDKYLVDYDVIDSHGTYLGGGGTPFTNKTESEITESLFIELDQGCKRFLDRIISNQQ